MSKPHHDLSPYLDSPQALYAHLEKDQEKEFRRVYFRMIVASLGFFAGLRLEGDMSSLGYWVAFLFGFMALWSLADLIARNWFMHVVSLRHLLNAGGSREG